MTARDLEVCDMLLQFPLPTLLGLKADMVETDEGVLGDGVWAADGVVSM